MAVPKIAVIALVAIIAAPILLGYAMNLTESTETDYKATGDAVNVTPLLQNGIGYTYSQGNTYQLNTKFDKHIPNNGMSPMLPIFESSTFTKSSLELTKTEYTGTHPQWGGSLGITLDNWGYLYYQSNSAGSSHYVIGNYCDPDGVLIQQIPRLHSFYYIPGDIVGYIYYTQYDSVTYTTLSKGVITVPNDTYRFGLTDNGDYASDGYAEYILNGNAPNYVDFSSGFHFIDQTGYIELTHYTKELVFTINLDSITDSNYEIEFFNGPVKLEKTTVDGVVTWKAVRFGGLIQHTLYYDSSRSDNTYQIHINIEKIGADSNRPGYDYYHFNVDMKYVGGWPTIIGSANAYSTYSYYSEIWYEQDNDYYYLDYIPFSHNGSRTPTMRVDESLFRSFEFPLIEDNTYDPKSFRSNPITIISDIQNYGKSLSFGGNTYNVSKDGKITVGGHSIPVNDLTFSSIPNENGGYDNKIGNTLISTTSQPSTIKFNGQWNASISTDSMESYSYTRTEWKAGSFAWDGIDQNFLMVGLITCLGVFVGLGIYARKRGSGGIIPLMIVTGCAAAVFFLML